MDDQSFEDDFFVNGKNEKNLSNKSIQELEELKKNTPNDAEIYKALGTKYLLKNEIISVFDNYHKYYLLNPSDHSFEGRLSLVGVKLIKQHGINKIYEYFDSTDNKYILYASIAKYYENLKNYEKAIEMLNEATKEENVDYNVYSLRAKLFQKLNDFEKSLEDYNESIKLSDNNYIRASLLLDKSRLFIEYKKYDEAKEEHLNIIKLFATNMCNLLDLINQFDLEDINLLINDLKALEIEKKTAVINRSIGMSNVFGGKYEEAIKIFYKILIHDPNDAEIYFCRAVSYMLLGNEKAASEDAYKACILDPNNDDYIAFVDKMIGTQKNDSMIS